MWVGLTKAAAWALVRRGSEQAAEASRHIVTAVLTGLGLMLGQSQESRLAQAGVNTVKTAA